MSNREPRSRRHFLKSATAAVVGTGLATTLPRVPGARVTAQTRPNDPGFPHVQWAHDCSTIAAPGPGTNIAPCSQKGFMRIWHNEPNSRDASVVPASEPIVSFGPQAPHGMPNVWRIAYPQGQGSCGSGTATCQNWAIETAEDELSGVSGNTPLRSVYWHYWFLLEGHDIGGGVRALQPVTYRHTYNRVLCRTHHHGGVNRLETRPGRNVATGNCENSGSGDGSKRYTDLSYLFQMRAPNGMGNVFPSTNSKWEVSPFASDTDLDGNPINIVKPSGCQIQVGRWHRVEQVVFLNTTADQPAGSMYMFLDGQLYGSLEDIVFRSQVGNFGCSSSSLDWFYGVSWRFCWHPHGVSNCPKQVTDYMCLADLFMSGVPVT